MSLSLVILEKRGKACAPACSKRSKGVAQTVIHAI